jgi:hypothetical protein
MTTKPLVTVADFCVYHNLEQTFIIDLEQAGLIEITIVDEITYIPESELENLERMIRMHRELDINVAGIEAITHLLKRIEDFQEEVRVLKNRLKLYE